MNSNRNNQTSSRIVGGRIFLVLALLGLVLGTAVPAEAQVGGIITTGTAVFGQARYPYAVVFNPSSGLPGYYIRVWMGAFRVMQIYPGRPQNGEFVMNYTIYHTMGHHWTLRGGADDSRSWSPETAGVFALDPRTIPFGKMALVDGYIGGRARQTSRAYGGVSVKWVSAIGCWWSAKFFPGTINQQMFQRWNKWARAVRNSTPRPKPLKDVTVNRNKVFVTMWDHGKEDNDVVDLYLNGKFLKRINLTNRGTTITLTLANGRHRFEVRARNEGTDKPNTAAISISGVVKGSPRQNWSLKTGQRTGMAITVIRR
ncbi:MAG: hypothetical protein QGH60_05580 [Phycisphaerae bacterium]|nr:hypothetical protein [Phycisphaerae bacterium]